MMSECAGNTGSHSIQATDSYSYLYCCCSNGCVTKSMLMALYSCVYCADVPLRNYSLTILLGESSPCNEHGTCTRSEYIQVACAKWKMQSLCSVCQRAASKSTMKAATAGARGSMPRSPRRTRKTAATHTGNRELSAQCLPKSGLKIHHEGSDSWSTRQHVQEPMLNLHLMHHRCLIQRLSYTTSTQFTKHTDLYVIPCLLYIHYCVNYLQVGTDS